MNFEVEPRVRLWGTELDWEQTPDEFEKDDGLVSRGNWRMKMVFVCRVGRSGFIYCSVASAIENHPVGQRVRGVGVFRVGMVSALRVEAGSGGALQSGGEPDFEGSRLFLARGAFEGQPEHGARFDEASLSPDRSRWLA